MANATISTISTEQLKKECIQNNVSVNSTTEFVRWVDLKDGTVTIETVQDYYKFNGGSYKKISELDLFVPAFILN